MLFKPSLFSFLLLLLAVCCYAQETPVVDSSYANGYYRQRVLFFSQMPHGKKEIVFLGNSITEAGEWQELIPNRRVKNRGISGDVTYGILDRLDEVLASKPSKIFILIGVNDLKRGTPVDTIAATYRRIVEKIKASSPKSSLYIQSVLPVNEAMLSGAYKKVSNAMINALNEKLVQLAVQSKCVYADVHSIMKDENGQLAKELTNDGIHLWPSTYIRWVNYLKEKKYL